MTRRALIARSVAAGAAVAGAGTLVGRAPSALAADNCFSKADRLGDLRVFQNAPPPRDDTIDATYRYWPCTDAAGMSDFSASTWSGRKCHYVWANRSRTGWNKKPNQLQPPTLRTSSGVECRVEYSTVERANAATQALVRYTLGFDSCGYTAPWIAAGGTAGDFVDYPTLAADPDSYFTTPRTVNSIDYMPMVDTPWLPSFRLSDVQPPTPGIVLDHEVQDDRGTASTSALLKRIAADVHSVAKQLFVWTNPLNAPSIVHTGLDATNLPGLARHHLDLLSVQLWSRNREGDIRTSYDDQIALLRGESGTEPVDYSRLAIVFELGDPGTTTTDASRLHDNLTDPVDPHPTVLMFWRDFATQDGACGSETNYKIAIACFGAA